MSAAKKTVPLFPGEPGPKVVRAEPPKGLVPIRELARATKTSPRTLKNRLLRLDGRVGGHLLVKMTEGGHYLVRLDVLRQHLPELVTPQLVEGETDRQGGLKEAGGLASEVRELRQTITELCDEVRMLRDVVIMGAEST